MEIPGHSAYLRQVFESDCLVEIVTKTNDTLNWMKANGIEFDAIAFRGQSGAGVAYPLAYRYGWKLLCVRKSSSHGRHVEASNGPVRKYVIVDDLIASGRTMDCIIRALPNAECVGIVLYWPDSISRMEYHDINVYHVERSRV